MLKETNEMYIGGNLKKNWEVEDKFYMGGSLENKIILIIRNWGTCKMMKLDFKLIVI